MAPAPPSICATSPTPGRNAPGAAFCRRVAAGARHQAAARGRSATIAAPHARHVVGERRAQRAADDIDRPLGRLRRATASRPNGSGRNPRSRHRGRSGRVYPRRSNRCSLFVAAPSVCHLFRPAGQRLACVAADCPAAIFTVSCAKLQANSGLSLRGCAALGQRLPQARGTRGRDVFGHRRGRFHRIECGRQPQ